MSGKLSTKTDIVAALRERGIHLKKSLGQNFLIDRNLLEFVVRAADVKRSDLVLEVGAGSGLLTRQLAESAGHVITVEVDARLADMFQEHTEGLNNITLLNCDVLDRKTKLNSFVTGAVKKEFARPELTSIKFVGNLPYAVSTIVIPLVLEAPWQTDVMVVTVQKEVCDRLKAGPGSKDYGALSVIVQAHAKVEMLRVLGRQVFFPQPTIDSAVVRLVPTKTVLNQIDDYAMFHELVHVVFRYRRKKLLTALEHCEKFELPRKRLLELLESCDISPDIRPDQLSIDQFISLANAFKAFLAG